MFTMGQSMHFNFIPIETPVPAYLGDPGSEQWVCYSYINFFAINDRVLIPAFGDIYENLDDNALNIIRQLLPGYTVKQFTFSHPDYYHFNWSGGFTHCFTHEISREDPVIPPSGIPTSKNIDAKNYDYYERFVSRNSITAGQGVVIKPGGFVLAKTDGEIRLQPGFTAEVGCFFRAQIAN